MDPKLFAAAQQSMGMNNGQGQNPNMMMSFQQQNNGGDLQQFNPLNAVPFNPANLGSGANLAFGPNDFANLDSTDLGNLNPFIQANPSLMNGMSLQQQQQQQHLRQNSHPQSVYSPQNLMALGNNQAALQAQFQQNRALYGGGNPAMMANTPQALMFQQQQQQAAAAAMAMNRAKQSPSQSPAMNHAHFTGNASSPVIGNSPHTAGGPTRNGSDYAVSPMNPNMGSPVQNFQQGNSILPSPQMARVIPSQANNNRYMQQMSMQQQHQQQQQQQQHQQHQQQQQQQHQQQQLHQQQQQQQHQQHQQAMMQSMGSASPSLNNPSISSYASPQDTGVIEEQQQKIYNTPSMSGYIQQQSPMQAHASPIPRQSATPGSTQSTPRQHHQQIETPHLSPTVVKARAETPLVNGTPSPKPTGSVPASPDEKNEKTVQQQITYIPKTRNVETYGGIDLKYFDKFEIKPPVPHLNELGVIDIGALIMSLKSGMKMEMTNALNILTVLTVQPQVGQQTAHIPLAQCEDLLDVLLDYLESDMLEEATIQHHFTYTDLFDMSLDEMKSLIPQLENSTSDIWISLRERCLCIFNILRNLSFMNENIEYLAKHERFVSILMEIMNKGREGVEAWFVGIRKMDTLDFRKSILMIFSNISMFLVLKGKNTAITFIQLIHDFLVHGPDTYYSLLAIETWTKLTVNYENRQLLHSILDQEPILLLLQHIWLELTAVIRRDFFSTDGRVMNAMTSNQLATLELTIIGLYNIVSIAESERLKQDLLQINKSIGMMIIRLCITLAESGNPQFGLVTKRGMELIRSLICGGDGIRRRTLVGQQQKRPSLEALSTYKSTIQEEENTLSVYEIANRVLDMPIVREKLMLSMLKPTTDPEILRELSDIVALIDEDSTSH